MLELFITALEDQLGLLVRPPLAPIARMNIISLEITRLTIKHNQSGLWHCSKCKITNDVGHDDCYACGRARLGG